MNIDHQVLAQIWNLSLDLSERCVAPFARGAIDFKIEAIKNNVTSHIVHGRPGGLIRVLFCGGVGRHANGRNIGVLNIVDLAGKAKLAIFGIGKRQTFQVALDFDGHVLNRSAKNSITHIVANILRNTQWQIPVNLVRTCTRNAALQIQDAHAIWNRAGLPAALPRTRCI